MVVGMSVCAAMNRVSTYLAAFVLAGSMSTRGLADMTGFQTPGFRGGEGSLLAGWERFSVATNNGVGNLPDMAGSTADARIFQYEPNAFVLGSGNIYNIFNKSEFELKFTAAEPVGLVVLQIRTGGFELDYASVGISYESGGVPQFLTALREETDRQAAGPGGVFVSSLWRWDLSALDLSSFTVQFKASEGSMSLDSVTIDTLGKAQTAVVPEPSVWALLAVGLAGGALLGWRRR